MKNKRIITTALSLALTISVFSQSTDKLISSKTHIKFFSETPAENIEANNYVAVSTITISTGNVVFSVPMQGFEFEKELMQKHFNSDNFLDTKTYPKSKFKASITNLEQIDFSKSGTYEALVKGELTIKGVTKNIEEKGTIIIKDGKVEIQSIFKILLSDYGITFSKGKPASNIAKEVEVTVEATY